MSSTAVFVLFGALILLAVLATFRLMARASKGYDKARRRRISAGPQAPCALCGSPMQLVGLQEFRLSEQASGMDEAAAAQLGAVAGNLPLEVHRCPTCRRLEFFLPPSAG